MKRALVFAILFMLIFTFSAQAWELPNGFKFSDDKPKGKITAVAMKDTSLVGEDGKAYSVKKGTELRLKGMLTSVYVRAKITSTGVSGYIKAEDVMLKTGVAVYVAKDCNAYEYKDGSNPVKNRAVWGTKLFMVGRTVDKNGKLWIMCVNSAGDRLAYIKKSNLYR